VYPAGRHAAAQHLPQIATATDNGGDEIGQLMFVVGDNGPLGYTPVGKPRPSGVPTFCPHLPTELRV
jgi:hypothetical protein